LLVFNVPDVSVKIPPVVLLASDNRYELPAPLIVILPKFLPADVIVCCVALVETKETADDAFMSVYVIPLTNLSAMFPAPAVPSPIVKVIALWVNVLV
jgi:hypothetical protein